MKISRIVGLILILSLAACNIPKPIKSTPTTVVQNTPSSVKPGSETGESSYGLQPSTKTVAPGATFELKVEVLSGNQKIDVAQASLNFDPEIFEVVSITPGVGLPTELINSFDNSQGIVDYAHGALPPAEPISGTFTLTTIVFKAKKVSPGSEIRFVMDLPRQSGIFYQGNSVAGSAPTSAIISVSEIAGSEKSKPETEQKAEQISPTLVISESTSTPQTGLTQIPLETVTPTTKPSPTVEMVIVPTESPTVVKVSPTVEEILPTATNESIIPTVEVTPPPSVITAPSTAGGLTTFSGGWKIFTIPAQAGDKILSKQSLVLDSSGNPHIVFGAGTLQYASLSPTGDWSIQTIDSKDRTGNFPSITISPSGTPQVSYFNLANEDLNFAYLENGVWTTENVDSKGAVGLFTSIASDKNNNPSIAYFDDDRDRLKIAQKEADGWKNRVVDSNGIVGFFASLGMNSTGLPRIAYYDFAKKDLKYAAGNENSAWKIYTPDKEGDVGKYVSMIIDSDGMPAFAYFDQTNEDLKFTRFDGKSWYIYVVDATGAVGWYPSLAIDSQNRPHILYLDQASGNLRYAILDAGKWKIWVLDNLGLTSTPPSIAVDSQDRPHIVFFDGNSGMLKYAVLENKP